MSVTSTPDSGDTNTPFGSTAPLYRKAGWFGTLPLPPGLKNSPPTGYTGYGAAWPEPATLAEWVAKRPNGNICLRLAGVDSEHEVIGIDVDHYTKGGKVKCGGDQLAQLIQTLGPLPDTWVSSARTDGVSGIRYFRVPKGLRFRGKVDSDIECVQKSHRYAVVWPSCNPDADNALYWWYPPGVELTKVGQSAWNLTIPDARELPLLPDAWIDHLTRGRMLASAEPVDMDSSVDTVYQWAYDTFGTDEPMCEHMRKEAEAHVEKIRDEATSHDKIVNAHFNLAQLAVEGHRGWDSAIASVEKAFIATCAERDKRSAEELRGEIFRSRVNGLRKIKGQCDQRVDIGAKPTDPRCAHLAGPDANRFATFLAWLKDHGIPGNPADLVHGSQVRMGKRLANEIAGRHIYVVGLGWLYWDGLRWDRDNDEASVYNVAINVLGKAVKSVEGSDSDYAKALRSDARRCNTDTGLMGMMKVARRDERISRRAGQLDSHPDLLNVQNGVVHLRTGEISQHDPSLLITKVCRGNYLPELARQRTASSFDAFIRRIMPKADMRRFLQRLMGMGMYGRMLGKMLPILTGDGDNGKNVFWEAINYAAGDYCAVFRPELLLQTGRDNQAYEVELRGVRWAIVSETPKDRFFSETTVKRLTGDRVITARDLYQKPITFDATHNVALVTNHPPNFTGGDAAMRARLVIVPFDAKIPPAEQDPDLGVKLEAEVDLVLTWVTLGAIAYAAHGLQMPAEVVERSRKYHDTNDMIGRWLSDRYKVGPQYRMEQSKGHSDFLDWATENDCWEQANALGRNNLLAELERRGFTKTRTNGVRWLNGLEPKLSLVTNLMTLQS
ncbi:hypothetical protein B1R94_07835 [Mycolicibacterium litorale]|nr:hypothetical protein B1R94_07835 [Mycolicibacterium litorale]